METTMQSGYARRRWSTDTYSGAAIGLLCLGLGVLLLILGPDPYLPAWLWFGLYLATLAAVVWAVGGWLDRFRSQVVYCGAVVLTWTVTLAMPDQGMVVVLLIAVAAVGSYVLPLRGVAVIVLLNSAVLAAQLLIQGRDLTETVVSVVFYFILQFASVLSTYALYRETLLRAELEQKNVELEAAGVLLEDSAKTAERLRISRELHDAVGHQLTVLNLELEAAKHRSGGAGVELGAHVGRAAAVAKDLLHEVRSTVGELRESEPGDLQATLERLAAAVPSLEIHVEVDDAVIVDDQESAALVRAAQEILTNTVKHSEAQELSLTVVAEGQGTVLTGTNDGLAPKRITHGHGLTGLRERVELLDGELSVSSSPQFTVEVRLPGPGVLSVEAARGRSRPVGRPEAVHREAR